MKLTFDWADAVLVVSVIGETIVLMHMRGLL